MEYKKKKKCFPLKLKGLFLSFHKYRRKFSLINLKKFKSCI